VAFDRQSSHPSRAKSRSIASAACPCAPGCAIIAASSERAVSEVPRLAIILGAGASHDCVPKLRPGEQARLGDQSHLIKQRDYQPPIVSGMFRSKAFNEFLNQHPEAADIFNAIRMEMSEETSFEVALRRRWESDNQHIRLKMRFVPRALQQFFWRVSISYTDQPANYVSLVSGTVGRGITTAFVTLNYDTILDKVLSRFRSWPHEESLTLGSYISLPDWLLVKLHGSVDWGYRLNVKGYLTDADLATQEFRDRDRAEIQVLDGAQEPRIGPYAALPALALPIEGKYGFVCPPHHEEALVDYLQGCPNFLFVGFSARDQDLLDLLSDNVSSVRRLWIVTGPNDQDDVKKNLRSIKPFRTSLASIPPEHTYTSFTDFVRSGLNTLATQVLSD